MLRSSALIAIFVSAGALVAADPQFAEYVPSDAKVLAGVQVRAIVDSDWGKAVIEQVKSASGEALMKGLPLKGVDMINDVDEVWIASSSVDKKAPSLVILRGRFDKSRLPAAIGRYHAVPLMPMDAKREQLLALVDESTIFAGDRFSVERAIDRRGLKSMDAHLAAAAAALRTRYWIWAVGDHLQDLVSANKTAPQGLDAATGFEFGIALNHDLEMAAQLHMKTAADAQKMLGTMAMLQMMAKSQEKGASQMNIESRVTGTTLDVSLRVPEEDLKQAWESQRAAIAESLSQLPQQLAAVRAGKSFNPFPIATQAQAPAQVAPSQASRMPVSNKSKIVSDQDGNTVQVTLPGR